MYILADPIDRYFQEGVLGLVGYKSYLYSAQDLFFALCAVVGLSNLARYPLLGWILANIAAAGFLLFPVYCLITGVMFRSNVLDLSLISFKRLETSSILEVTTSINVPFLLFTY